MHKFRFQTIIAALLFFVTSCQSSSNKPLASNTVRINLAQEPHTLDPRLARDPNSQMLLRMLFEGLTRIGPGDQPQLAIAQSVEISEDLKTYKFTLRNAKWSNGDPVIASDFSYAWKKILSPDFITDNAFHLYLLKNGKAVKDGTLPPEELGVIAIDDRTLLVELEYPTPYILELLASPFFFPVNQKIDETLPKWAEKQETYVSNGPFILSHWRHHDLISVQKNLQYWEFHAVKLDAIEMVMLDETTEMNLFEKKQLHWAGSPLSTIPVDAIAHLKQKGNLFVKPRAETAFLRVNTQRSILEHAKIRHALAMAIDREAIVKHVTQGGQLPATHLVPPSMQLQKAPYFRDGENDKAASLFEEALSESGFSKEECSKLTLTYIHSNRGHLIAQAIQQQWEKVFGVRIKLEAIERKVYFDRLSHKAFDLAFCSWGADFHDPVNFLEVFKYKMQSTNNTGWEDPIYIRMLNDTSRLVNPDERYQLLAACEKRLIDAMPIIPIFHYSMLYLKDEKLKGVFLSSLGSLDFKWANLENED